MRYWLRGYRGGLLAFGLITALVAGGLSWLTVVALRLEAERLEARAREKVSGEVQLAMSLMDSRVRDGLARENSRPYHHYSAIFAPSLLFFNNGSPTQPGAVVEPSPLLAADLPDWMLLHFQVSVDGGWSSPYVLSPAMQERFRNADLENLLVRVTPERACLLEELRSAVSPTQLASLAEANGARPSLRDTVLAPPAVVLADQQNPTGNPQANAMNQAPQPGPGQQQSQAFDPNFRRAGTSLRASQETRAPTQRDYLEQALLNTKNNGESWFQLNKKHLPRGEPIEVVLSPMVPLWLPHGGAGGPDWLVLVRVVQIADQRVCQGIVLDWKRLQEVLGAEVLDPFPQARLMPVRPGDELPPGAGVMASLPVRLDPGPDAFRADDPGWTPLRVGLTLAWAAALVALLAVGLGGRSLIDLSERRIRFVSAVTHELRTPLTTLRLYLDMLTGGVVREESQKDEYLRTLQAEAERLHRLVGNVLDFARLESNRPRLNRRRVRAEELLGQVRVTWEERCRAAAKELVVEDAAGAAELDTDPELMQQIVGNLVDNACKYTQGAEDGHIWVRSRVEDGRLVLEVEDRGPGVSPREGRAIFRPFRRGRAVETTAGVGLGLALARRWAVALGGSLTLTNCRDQPGACFRVELPLTG